MRILIDGRLYGLENAGLGRYIINLVKHLAKPDSKNEYVILLREKYYESVELPSNWTKIKADFGHYSFAEQIYLPFIIASKKPDLTHFPHFNVPILFNGRYVVTIHDTLMHTSKGLASTTLPRGMYFIKRIGYRIAFGVAVRRAKLIIVPSQSVKKDLQKIYNIAEDKICVTYEAVDEMIVEKSSNSDIKGKYFVYAGNAYPHKNLENLVRAVKIVNGRSKTLVRLVVASSRNVFTARLTNLIKDLKAERFINLTGFVTDSRLYTIFKNSVAFVFPSLSEGFGLPGLEAMRAGTLVLASNIPVFKEVYENNAIYFDPRDPQSIAHSMEEALNIGGSERSRIIGKSQNFITKYSWDKMASETLKIYSKSVKMAP